MSCAVSIDFSSLPGFGLNILIVDDQTYNLFVLEELLMQLGVDRIQKALNGLQALEVLDRS